MASIIMLREGVSVASGRSALYSPAKEKAATRGAYPSRSPLRRIWLLIGGAKFKRLLSTGIAFALLLISGGLGSLMGWKPNPSSSVYSPSRASASDTMVGFVPRVHWLDKEKDGVAYYRYGGWCLVRWMGTYSMVLSKLAFSTESTWICTPIRCPLLFVSMQPEKEIVKTLPCLCYSLMPLVLLQSG